MSDFSIDYQLNNAVVAIEYDYLDNVEEKPDSKPEVWINRVMFKDIDILDVVSDKEILEMEKLIIEYLCDPEEL